MPFQLVQFGSSSAELFELQITLGIDFDHGYWPGPLVDREASAGEAWVGPAGLLSILETALGLGGPRESEVLRAARLVPRVLEIEGFWSESAQHNPLATARTLLRWRDRLWMQGWRGEPLVPRLELLSTVTESAGPGFADRLAAVTRNLPSAFADLASLELCEPRESWAPAWVVLFAKLEAAGVAVSERGPGEVGAAGDLAGAQKAMIDGALNADGPGLGADPDGSLQLLRPYGPVQAAEEVAVWLKTLPDLEGTVVIGGDPVLDRALRAQGLPTTGASSAQASGALLQVLPLVLALGWDPPDPQRALELLALPVGPIPWEVRRRLQDALAQWPAVGSEDWDKGLREGLAEIEDESRRKLLEHRLEVVFKPTVRRGEAYPATEVVRRTQAVQHWLTGRKAADEDGGLPWDASLAQCRVLLALIDASGLAELSAPQLDRFANQATRSATEPAPLKAEVGLTNLSRPGSIVGPVRRVVWWGFDVSSAAGPQAWFLSPTESRAVGEAGIALPDMGREAMEIAARWRRPLLYARDSVLLVCPMTGETGDTLYPHPLWDEITGLLGEQVTSARTVTEPLFAEKPLRLRMPFVELPAPRREWDVVPERVGPRESESLTGLTNFLGCSLHWAMTYHAKLRAGRSNQVTSEAALLGSLLHEVVERVLAEEPASPEAAQQRALELFDELGPRLAAPLYLPGADAQRSHARWMAGVGASRLAEILAADDRRVLSTEASYYRQALGAKIGGRLDLVVGDPPGIIDLKLGSARFRREELKSGTAGLAVYSYAMQGKGDPLPSYAYFIFTEQALLSTDDDYFSQAEHIDGPGGEETWKAWKKAWADQRGVVDQGRLEAPGNPDEQGEIYPKGNAVVDGRVVVEPPCRFCDFPALCGRFFGEAGE